ncbi:MAG: BolA family protein [Gammaproteobacteria bacterium]
MTNEQLQILLMQIMPDSQVIIDGDGYHFMATIVSDAFAGLSKVKRQQLVYQGVSSYITSGKLHALTLSTYTPEEWTQHG